MPTYEIQLAAKRKREVPPIQGPGTFWLLILIILILSGLAVSIFGTAQQQSGAVASLSPTPQPTRQSRIYTVYYKNGVFSPTNLRIHVGDTVRFRNDGVFPIRIVPEGYPENADLPGFASVGDIPQGSFFAYTFSVKGIFTYYNEKNAEEQGVVIVR